MDEISNAWYYKKSHRILYKMKKKIKGFGPEITELFEFKMLTLKNTLYYKSSELIIEIILY